MKKQTLKQWAYVGLIGLFVLSSLWDKWQLHKTKNDLTRLEAQQLEAQKALKIELTDVFLSKFELWGIKDSLYKHDPDLWTDSPVPTDSIPSRWTNRFDWQD